MKKWELKPGDKVRIKLWLPIGTKAKDGLELLDSMMASGELTVDKIASNGNFTTTEDKFYYSPEFVDRSYRVGSRFTVRTDLYEGDFCDGVHFLNEMKTTEVLKFLMYNKKNEMFLINGYYYSPEMLILWKEQ